MLTDVIQTSLMLRCNHHRHIKREPDEDEGSDDGGPDDGGGGGGIPALDGDIVDLPDDESVEPYVQNLDEDDDEEEEENNLVEEIGVRGSTREEKTEEANI